MNIFISWSGDRSRYVAQSLADWIPDVFQDIGTWMSEQDIAAGSRWGDELAMELQSSDFGILCLTPENTAAPWLLFEAGALSKLFNTAHVVPYRLDLEATDVRPPLSQFQGVNANRNGTEKLMLSINAKRATPLNREKFDRTFKRWWPDLEKQLSETPKSDGIIARRSERDLIDEILGQLRTISRYQGEHSKRLSEIERYLLPQTVKSSNTWWKPYHGDPNDTMVSCRVCSYVHEFVASNGEHPPTSCPECGTANLIS